MQRIHEQLRIGTPNPKVVGQTCTTLPIHDNVMLCRQGLDNNIQEFPTLLSSSSPSCTIINSDSQNTRQGIVGNVALSRKFDALTHKFFTINK